MFERPKNGDEFPEAGWVERAKTVHIRMILHQRNIKLHGRGGNLAGPCPVCGGTDRFAVHLGKQLFNCRSCGGKGHGAISFVMFVDGVNFIEAIKRINNSPPPIDGNKTGTISDAVGNPDAERSSSARRLWREAGPIEGTVGIRYLEHERGIFDLPPDPHSVLRFHPRCVFGQDRARKRIFHGCILALYRDIVTNEPTGVHRIALDANGKLIGRMGLGRKQGSAIKFWDDSNVSIGLVVGEGAETVLAAAMHVQHKGTTLRPAWSLVDASNLERFPILGGIEHLTVLADADANNRGQQAARTCAKRSPQSIFRLGLARRKRFSSRRNAMSSLEFRLIGCVFMTIFAVVVGAWKGRLCLCRALSRRFPEFRPAAGSCASRSGIQMRAAAFNMCLSYFLAAISGPDHTVREKG